MKLLNVLSNNLVYLFLINLSKKKIISENKEVSGPMEFVTDISKIKKIIDWEPKYDIRSGLKKTYDIMRAYNQNNL